MYFDEGATNPNANGDDETSRISATYPISLIEQTETPSPKKRSSSHVTPRISNSHQRKTLEKSPSSVTPLHSALLAKSAPLRSLRAHLTSRPSAASVKDGQGRLPLHLLSLNSHRFRTGDGSELKRFALQLFHAYPLAAVTPDRDGKVPFSYEFHDWVDSEIDGGGGDGTEEDEIRMMREWQGVASVGRGFGNAESSDSISVYDAGKSFFAKAFHRSEESVRGDAPSVAPSVSPSVAHSIGGNSVWTYRREKRVDVVKMQQKALQRKKSSSRYHTSSFANSEISNSILSDTTDMVSDNNSPMRNSERPANIPLGGDSLECSFNKASKAYPEAMRNFGNIEEGSVAERKLEKLEAGNESFIFPKSDKVTMSPYCLWCFEMLHIIHESFLQMEGENPQYAKDKNDPIWLSNVLVRSIASIPNLVKVLLFSHNLTANSTRIPIIINIMTSSAAVGNWIVYMFEVPSLARRGVQYIELFRTVEDARDRFVKIGYLDYIVPSILSQDDVTLVTRAARTELWDYVTYDAFRHELILWIVLDLIAHVVILASFQDHTDVYLNPGVTEGEGTVSFLACSVAVSYFGVRKVNQFFSFFKIGRFGKPLWRYAFAIPDVLEVTALVSAFVGMTAMHLYDETPPSSREGLMVFVTLLVWANFLRWVRMVNRDVATFVGILGKILQDIRHYLVVLAVLILSTSQSFKILQYSSCQEDTCINPYLQSFSAALGMADPANYTTSPGSVITFIFLAAISILLLFTTLIAMVSSSYRSAQLKPNQNAAYQERFVYFAHTKTFHTLFSSDWTLMQYCAVILFLSTAAVLLLLSVESKRAAMVEYYGMSQFVLGVIVVSIFLIVSLLAFESHITFYDMEGKMRTSGANKETTAGALPGGKLLSKCVNAWRTFLRWAARPVRAFVDVCVLSGPIDTAADERHGGPACADVATTKQLRTVQNAVIAELGEEIRHAEKNSEESGTRGEGSVLAEMKSSQLKCERMILDLQTMFLQMQNNIDFTPKTERGVVADVDDHRAETLSFAPSQEKDDDLSLLDYYEDIVAPLEAKNESMKTELKESAKSEF